MIDRSYTTAEAGMIREAHIPTLLAKAKEAEGMAAKAKDDQSRDAWLRIAESYRFLAKTA